MEKPNLMENYVPLSGHYSLKKDLRLNAWLGVATILYGVALWLTKHHPDWSPLTRALVSLAPLVPALLYVRSWMRLVRSMDELQRRIQLEAFLFAALGTVGVGVILSTLNAHGLRPFGVMQAQGLGLGGAFLSLFALWLLGWGLATRRYK